MVKRMGSNGTHTEPFQYQTTITTVTLAGKQAIIYWKEPIGYADFKYVTSDNAEFAAITKNGISIPNETEVAALIPPAAPSVLAGTVAWWGGQYRFNYRLSDL